MNCDYPTLDPDLQNTPQARLFPTTTYGTPNRNPNRCDNRQGCAPGWAEAIVSHRRDCNTHEEDRPMVCDLECPLRARFPKT